MTTTTITTPSALALETDLVNAFWEACRAGGDRLALLQDFTAVQVQMPPGWDPKAIRAAFVPRPFPDAGCFACYRRDRRMHWHHIIAVDHGGSNGIWNQVPVCHVCHRRIHPWLLDEPDQGTWISGDQLVTRIALGQIAPQTDRRQIHDDEGHYHYSDGDDWELDQ